MIGWLLFCVICLAGAAWARSGMKDAQRKMRRLLIAQARAEEDGW